MYERLGRWTWDRWRHRWGVVLAFVFASIFSFVMLPLSMVNVAAVFELSIREACLLYAVLATASFTILLIGFQVVARRPLAAIDAWAAGDRSDPDRTRDAALHMMRELLPRLIGSIGPPIVIVGTGVIASVFHLGWQGAVGFAIQATGLVVINLVFTPISFDLLLRPLREEIDAVLPAQPEGRGVTLAARLKVGAALLAWGCVVFASAIVVQFDSPAAQFGVAGIAGAATATMYSVVFFGGLIVAPLLRPMEDLLRGTRRVAAGVYDQRLPVTTDDEFGELIASFNEMQTGLLERERLHAAFGSYVDPALAQRLIAQGDDLFAGEEVEVTVFFADVRGFTPYAEQATPQETVERLNSLFSLVVPILRDHHGHANKFLGDGVLAVFGVPEPTDDHADLALAAAIEIQRQVLREFGESLRLGIGINTGRVVAGTIGGGGKLEFTLIGDAVNVAARVEERTKTTGDPILLTQSTLDALREPPAGLIERGDHELKGKSAATRLYAAPIT